VSLSLTIALDPQAPTPSDLSRDGFFRDLRFPWVMPTHPVTDGPEHRSFHSRQRAQDRRLSRRLSQLKLTGPCVVGFYDSILQDPPRDRDNDAPRQDDRLPSYRPIAGTVIPVPVPHHNDEEAP